MPTISEDDYKEFLELKRKEKEREETIERIVGHGVNAMRQWKRKLFTINGCAAAFCKELQREYEARGCPKTFVLDRITEVFDYLPKKCLVVVDGNAKPSDEFRKACRRYGWGFRLDRKHNLFEVKRLFA